MPERAGALSKMACAADRIGITGPENVTAAQTLAVTLVHVYTELPELAYHREMQGNNKSFPRMHGLGNPGAMLVPHLPNTSVSKIGKTYQCMEKGLERKHDMELGRAGQGGTGKALLDRTMGYRNKPTIQGTVSIYTCLGIDTVVTQRGQEKAKSR